jgi:hypothetical protein
MFLIDRPAISPGLRADLAPRQLFGGAGDLVRAALTARPPLTSLAAPFAPRAAATQLDLALPAPARRRKAG